MKAYLYILFSIVCFAQSHAQEIKLYPARNGNAYGLIDKTGKVVIDYQYYSISRDKTTGNFIVMKDAKQGVLSPEGKELLPPKYWAIDCFKDGSYYLLDNKVRYYITPDGNRHEIKYGSTDNNYTKGIFPIVLNKKKGYVDINNKIIIPADYDVSWKNRGFYEGFVILTKGDSTFFFNSNGDAFFKTDMDVDKKWNGQGLLSYKENRKWGLMGIEGVKYTEAIYTYINDFKDGFARAKTEDKRIVYLDVNGKEYTQKEYGKLQPNKYWVMDDPDSYQEGLFTKEGKALLPFDFNNFEFGDKGMFTYSQDRGRKYMLRNNDAKLVKTFERVWYLEAFEGDLILVHHNDESDESNTVMYDAYYDASGKMVWKGDTYTPECFPAEAQINLADGSKKAIADIKAGDMIMAYDFDLNKPVATEVIETMEHSGDFTLNALILEQNAPYASYNEFVGSSSLMLELTSKHKIASTSGPQTFHDIDKSDLMFGIDGDETHYLHLATGKESQRMVNKVYNLKTSQGNYFVNGVLVMVK